MEIIYVIFLTFVSAVFAVSSDIDMSLLSFDPIALLNYILGAPKLKQIENEESDEEDEIEPDNKIKREETYDEKYKREFRNMPDSNSEDENDDSWESRFVVEHTPIGNVFMSYDIKRETFVYYADHIIPFRFLEVVSRKFALIFHCKHLVVDVELEEEKLLEEQERTIIEDENKDEESEEKETTTNQEASSKVFAKFKNYNKQQSGPSSVGVKETTKLSSKNTKPVVEKSNRYSCQGKIANMDFLKKPKKNTSERQKLSFAEFKKTLL